jgi:hypothetical protein
MTPDLVEQLLELLADAAAATEFAYWTLLRRGNVLGAVWTWFQLEVEDGHVVAGGMRVPGTVTKNRKALTLPLTGALLPLIDRRWQGHVTTCPYVFQRADVPLRRFDESWRRAATAIGRGRKVKPDRTVVDRGLLFHDLRRSAARTLRRAGVDPETIMKLGGWKTRSMLVPLRRPGRHLCLHIPPNCHQSFAVPSHSGRVAACPHAGKSATWTPEAAGVGRPGRLKIARAHALRGSTPLLGMNESATLSMGWPPTPCSARPDCA